MQHTDSHSVAATQTKIRQRVGSGTKMEYAEILGTTLKHLIHRAFTTHGRHLC